MRESEGHYKYGRKRVFMKIESDKIIIRVGGGYLTIEEFIEQYCDENRVENLYKWVYHGDCKGANSFKTFYFTKNDESGKLDLPDYPNPPSPVKSSVVSRSNSVQKISSNSKRRFSGLNTEVRGFNSKLAQVNESIETK